MAAVIELVKRRDFGEDVSSLSLFNFEDGFSLARDGWIQAATSDDEVTETMTLHVKGTSHNDLADKLKLLDDKIQEAAWYSDGVERYGVWLRAKLTDEGGARQALVTGMQCEPAVSFYAPTVAPGNFIREGYHLALTRMPYWEATSYLHSYGIGSLNCTGGLDFVGLVQGNAPARIAQTEFKGMADGGGPLYEFWLGFRTDRLGTAANLTTVWDIGQYGSGSNDTTTGIVDATAHAGYSAECTFGTETELRRAQVILQSVTINYEDQRGSYIVLLRAKVGADTTCHVRLKDGFLYTSAIRSQPRVKITSTDWLLHTLGTVNIPPSHGVREAEFLREYGFEIHASRTAGDTGYLYMDCFILIPYTEGAIHITGAAVQRIAADQRPATIIMTADGLIDGWAYQSNLPRASLVIEPSRYALPTGNSSFVLAGQRETSHVLTDFVNVNLRTYRRWRSLRGHDEALDDY